MREEEGASLPADESGGFIGFKTGDFPERMKANKAMVGQICPSSNGEIELGDDVYNCRACNSASHADCCTESGGCPSPSCLPDNEAPQKESTDESDTRVVWASQDKKKGWKLTGIALVVQIIRGVLCFFFNRDNA